MLLNLFKIIITENIEKKMKHSSCQPIRTENIISDALVISHNSDLIQRRYQFCNNDVKIITSQFKGLGVSAYLLF